MIDVDVRIRDADSDRPPVSFRLGESLVAEKGGVSAGVGVGVKF